MQPVPTYGLEVAVNIILQKILFDAARTDVWVGRVDTNIMITGGEEMPYQCMN